MKLEHVNTREKLTVRLYDHRGRTIKSSVRKIERLMRCHYTGRRHRIHWRLIQRLYRISRHFKGRVIRVYSGYRSRKVARLKTSKHTMGRAVDFAVRGVSTRKLRDYIRRTYKKSRGLGYYPNTPFVHFDIRKKSAFWVDYSGRGEEPRYANPWEVLKRERLAARRKKKGSKKTKKIIAKRVASPAAAKTQRAKVLEGPPAPPRAARTAVPVPVMEGPPAPTPVLEGPPAPRQPASPRKAASAPPSGPDPVGPAPGAKPVEKKPTARSSKVPSTKEQSGAVSNVRSAPL